MIFMALQMVSELWFDLLRMERQESEVNRAGINDSVEEVKLKGVNKSTET